MDRAGPRLEPPISAAGEGTVPEEGEVARWAASGLQALTGPPDGPGLGPPRGLVGRAEHLAAALARRSTDLGRPVVVDPLDLMAARAAHAGLHRRGAVSCGGAARLLAAADGWVAVNLSRPDDWALVEAWLELSAPVAPERWPAVEAGVAGRRSSELVGRATLLGLPVAALGEVAGPGGTDPDPPTPHGVGMHHLGDGSPPTSLADLVVVDLSALWAGPLAAHLLAEAGARVVKVESTARPDGARRGSPSFYDALNRSKASVALDLATPDGRRRLGALVDRAHVVITAARPRALRQLGLDPDSPPPDGHSRVWLSITGYGTEGPAADRVAFGDDAAVAGGLVATGDSGVPYFCADAVADPLSGLAGATAVLDALARGGSWRVEVAMAGVAAGFAGRTLDTGGREGPAPVAPPPGPAAPPLGADTDDVLRSLGIG